MDHGGGVGENGAPHLLEVSFGSANGRYPKNEAGPGSRFTAPGPLEAASAEKLFNESLFAELEVGSDVRQDGAQSPDLEGVMIGYRDVMLPVFQGRQPQV